MQMDDFVAAEVVKDVLGKTRKQFRNWLARKGIKTVIRRRVGVFILKRALPEGLRKEIEKRTQPKEAT